MKARNYDIDALKFLLIALVIWGHFIIAFRTDTVNSIIYDTLYRFHMPLFIAISGYFSSQRPWTKTLTIVRRFLRILLTFQICWISIGFLKNLSISLQDLYYPINSLWYIAVLVWCKLLLSLLPPITPRNGLLIVVIIGCLSLVLQQVVSTKILAIGETIQFLPYFLVGYLLKVYKFDWSTKIRSIPYWIAMLTIGLLAGYFALLYTRYEAIRLVNASPIVITLESYVMAFLLSVTFVRLVEPLLQVKILQNEGQHTLHYYLYEGFIGLISRNTILKLHLPCGWFFCIIYVILTILILKYMRRIKMLNFIIS